MKDVVEATQRQKRYLKIGLDYVPSGQMAAVSAHLASLLVSDRADALAVRRKRLPTNYGLMSALGKRTVPNACCRTRNELFDVGRQ